MELLPNELKIRLPPLHSQDREDEPMVWARFFLPDSSLVWYPFEGQDEAGDYIFLGFVLGPDDFRTFRLSELEGLRNHAGLPVQRDVRFIPGRLTDVVPAPDV